jgi:hypothetical protein
MQQFCFYQTLFFSANPLVCHMFEFSKDCSRTHKTLLERRLNVQPYYMRQSIPNFVNLKIDIMWSFWILIFQLQLGFNEWFATKVNDLRIVLIAYHKKDIVRVIHLSWVLVPHTYNPSYSGGRDQEDLSSKPMWANSWWDPISKKTFTKKGWWNGYRYRSLVQTPVLKKKKKDSLEWYL